MTEPQTRTKYTYDAAGRVTQLAKVVGTNAYNTYYKYNSGDEPTQLQYPSGRVVQSSYNYVGQPCEIAPSTTTCGSASSPYATGYGYNASGQLTGLKYGNGIYASLGYSSRQQMSCLDYSTTNRNGTCTHDTNSSFGLNYYYALDSANCPNGTPGNDNQIQCITDSVNSGRTANYTFDALGRINTAITNGSSGFPQWGLSWSYDRYGNRLSQTVTAGMGPSNSLSFANPGGAQTNRPDGWCFDASGNLLAKSGTCPPAAPTFVFDGENRMVSDGAATMTYDGNGVRVQKCLPNCTSPTSSTVFIFSGSQDIAEYDNGAAPSAPSREFIYSDGLPGSGLLATITGGSSPTITYFHDDHLDWRISTDGTTGSPTYGQVIGYQGHYPFGESWYSNNGNEFVFTTYQRDSESGLDYAMARYYDSTAARFCSADPLGGRLDDPQTWNRYTYSRNDPVNLVDPSGQGFLSWLIDALLIGADILTSGVFAPESAAILGTTDATIHTANLVITGALGAAGAATAYEQSKSGGQTQSAPPPLPPPPPNAGQVSRLNCIQKALNAQFPNAHFKRIPDTPTPTEGGHINGTFSSGDISPDQANSIKSAVNDRNATRLFGLDKGSRFPDGLHAPSGDATIKQSPTTPDLSNISITGHVDRYNPRSSVGSTIGHVVVDYGLGHLVQIFHKNLDRRCN